MSGFSTMQNSNVDKDTDLWLRLRESMERLQNIGQQKNDPNVVAEKLARRAQRLRCRKAAPEPDESPLVFVAFNKSNQRYGISVNDVIEVQALQHFSPVPGVPSFISGVTQWRGEVLTLLDLVKLFGIPEAGLMDVHVCLIVEAARRRVALIAHEVEEILTVPKGEIHPTPDLPHNIPSDWLIGVHDDNRMILNLEFILSDGRVLAWRD